MHIFVDESGTNKQADHSSVALVFVETANVEKLQSYVSKIERSLRLDGFHWARHSWVIRKQFFQAIAPLDFSVGAVVFQNPMEIEQRFSSVFVALVPPVVAVHQVIIDGKKTRRYELALKKALRDRGIPVKKLKTADDESYPGLRLADAMAGLIRSHADDPQGKAAESYFLLKNKITTLSGGQVAG